jgi:16S rRNA (uracil1498-N3)-methyltransferase
MPPRILIRPEDLHGRTAVIQDAKALHHLLHVLRTKPGDAVECFDGTGRSYRGRVARATRRELVVEVRDVREEPSAGSTVTVAAALIRAQRFEWMIQKVTELGARRIVPLLTERTLVRPGADRSGDRLRRWRRIAEEAAQQCGRATVPPVEAPVRFAQFLAPLAPEEVLLVPTLAASTVPLRQALARRPGASPAVVAVGPEGDFTPGELVAAQRAGGILVSLGRLTLRSETAAVAALAGVQLMAEQP